MLPGSDAETCEMSMSPVSYTSKIGVGRRKPQCYAQQLSDNPERPSGRPSTSHCPSAFPHQPPVMWKLCLFKHLYAQNSLIHAITEKVLLWIGQQCYRWWKTVAESYLGPPWGGRSLCVWTNFLFHSKEGHPLFLCYGTKLLKTILHRWTELKTYQVRNSCHNSKDDLFAKHCTFNNNYLVSVITQDGCKL